MSYIYILNKKIMNLKLLNRINFAALIAAYFYFSYLKIYHTVPYHVFFLATGIIINIARYNYMVRYLDKRVILLFILLFFVVGKTYLIYPGEGVIRDLFGNILINLSIVYYVFTLVRNEKDMVFFENTIIYIASLSMLVAIFQFFNFDFAWEMRKFINFNDDLNDPITNQSDMMQRDIQSYLPDDLLVKIDRAAMSASLETRTPFLDRDIVEYSANVPINHKIYKNKQKIILKKILSKYLPERLYERPKMGFEVPIDDWIRGPLRDFTYDSINSLRTNSPIDLNFKTIDKKINEHMAGSNNWHYQIWNIIIFQKWCDRYL